jgi:hypothetical protein
MTRIFLLLALFALAHTLRAQATLATPGSAKPLFLVNGVVTEDIGVVRPENIERIEVLRAADAVRKYGSQAKDGAVLITTKNPVRLNYRDPRVTEMWEPMPAKVAPGNGQAPPSDAIVLFNGSDLSEWQGAQEGEARWQVSEGKLTVVKGTGDIKTKRTFGDIQLHIEWQTPSVIESEGQGRGNSGVFLQERYEVQILDSYDNTTYPNGQAGAIYKQHIPLVNASRAPGEWQTFDIIFTAPKFGEKGRVISPARITVLHNGVLIQNQVEIWGSTEFIGLPKYAPHGKGAIRLQDHGNPVSFRNIWVREL